MTRREFPVSVQRAAYERSGGICECGCGRPFTNHPKGAPHYDHHQADNLGGKPDLDNCRVIRVDCHRIKTATDMKMIAKARRGEKRRVGIKAPTRKILGSRGTGIRKPLNGPAYRVKE